MKPNFDSPVHTARDLVEKNITVYQEKPGKIWKQWLSQYEIPEYKEIGEKMIITETWDQFSEMTKNELLRETFIKKKKCNIFYTWV